MERRENEFALSTRLVWGRGTIQRLGAEAAGFGNRALLTFSPSIRRSGLLERIQEDLSDRRIRFDCVEVEGEPTLGTVEAALRLARESGIDFVIGIGGGSPIDAGKAVAGLYNEPREVRDYFYGHPVTVPGVPLIAVPTVAGSGAEVTPNAVLSDPDRKVKLSIRHSSFVAKLALIDPELSVGVGPQATAFSGLDGLCQAIEAFVSRGANAVSDLWAREAATRFARHLPRAVEWGNDIEARESLAVASFMGGIALASARLGAVHGLAHPIGVRYRQPHGKVCAVLLPMVMRFNLASACEKYAVLARELGLAAPGMDAVDQAAQLIKFIINLNKRLGIPQRLRDLGVVGEDFAAIVAESLPSGSLQANPREMKAGDIEAILRENL